MYKMGYIQEHKFSLLYVEDDKTLRDQYKEFFARRVDSFLEATNGKEGLEMFVAYQPDIVVTDLLMPVMDGIEMIQEIKKLSPNTKIIITTAYGDTKYTLSAIDLNVTKYILKPMRGSHLNQIIEEVKELIILQREKEIYKSYIETIINTQPSMVILNKKRDIMIANKIFLEFLGFESLEEFKLNHHCICEFFEIDTDFFHYNKSDWIERALEMINSNKAVEVKIKDEVFSVLVSYIEDKSEYVITLSNITIQKKFELELKKRLDTELEKNKKQESILAQQSKLATMGEMMSLIAHQWRQPLNAISLKKDILVDEYENNELNQDKIKKFDKNMEDTLQYMSKTIDDFRNFFKPSKKKENFDVVEAINSVLSIVSPQLTSNHIELIVEKNRDNIPYCGYQNEFKQVVMNLINNARDAILKKIDTNEYIDDGDIKIYITYSDTTKNIEISIRDSGTGIEDSIKEKIFEPYFTTKSSLQGTGLGLYMSKTIIESNMGGNLFFKSDKDGTEFIIKLNHNRECGDD
jgi:signal transduction histidine kinase/DNA-binding NarL/FixJ family response regulator